MINRLMGMAIGALIAASASAALDPVLLNQRIPDEHSTWDFVLSGAGEPWFAYYGTDNLLYVRRPGGDEVALGATDRSIQQSGLALAPLADDAGVSVFWRDKLPLKTLYLIPGLETTGPAPDPIVVGAEEDSQPLTRLKLARVEDANYLLWTGEKPDPVTGEPYHLHFRVAGQTGKTLSPVEQVMPGIYPAWIVDRDVIPVFSWMTHEGQLAMTMRVFDRTEQQFGPVVKIADAPIIAPIFEAFQSGSRWFLLWLGSYDTDDSNELLLEGVYSDDRGQTWKRFAFEELRGLDIGTIHVATDHKQHIVLVLDGSWRFKDPTQLKSDIHIVRSTDNGATWQRAQTVRPKEARATHARFPLVASGQQPGTLMLAWEDWRDIRPNIYVTYSRDYGATWEPSLPLARPGIWNLGMEPYPRVMLSHDDRFHLIAKHYSNDALARLFDYRLYTLTWDQVRKNAETFKLAERQALIDGTRLRERVETYWQAMRDRQYETAYALMDPFFRHTRDLETYLSQSGIIKYHRYQIGEISRHGNIARVKVEIESSVPEFTTPSGQTISQSAKTIQLVDTWLFVNDNWYREYYDQQAERPLTRY